MFKSLSNSFRSFWQPKSNENTGTQERKRKRPTDDTHDDQEDSDVEIISVKKPKQDTGSSPSFLSFLKYPVSKMSELVRKKTMLQDYFFTQPIPSDSHWSRDRGPEPGGGVNRDFGGGCSSVSNVTVTNGSHAPYTHASDILSRPPINCKSVSSENGLNGDVHVVDTQPGAHSFSVSSSRRSSCSSSRPGTGRRTGAEMCFQLQERQNYLKLLQEFTTFELGYHGNKAQQNQGSLTSSRLPQRKSGAFLPLSSGLPPSTLSSSMAGAAGFLADGANTSTSFNTDSHKSFPRFRVAPNCFAKPSVLPSDRTVSEHQVTADSFVIPGRPGRGQAGQSSSSKPLSRRSRRTSQATGTDARIKQSYSGNKDPDVIVIDDEPSKETKSSARLDFKSSEFMDDDWLAKLNEKYTQSEKDRQELIKEAEMKKRLWEERREGRLGNLDKKLRQQMRLFEEEPEVIEELPLPEVPQEKPLPELTDAMEREVQFALEGGPPSQILVEGFRLQLTRADLSTLRGLNWLNDEVINFYMNMLMERGEQTGFSKTYAFNTFFYPKLVQGGHDAVKRWTRKIDVFAHDYLVIPVHLGVHWCLCVVFMKDKKICYYDSMGGTNNQCLNAVRQYLADESKQKKNIQLDLSQWSAEIVKDIPQQMNGSDCGMFSCMYAETLTRGAQITFTQKDMPYFRRRMVYEILKKKLLS